MATCPRTPRRCVISSRFRSTEADTKDTLTSMPKALIFDVFGTCVDWRSSVAREVAAVLPDLDATGFRHGLARRIRPGHGAHPRGRARLRSARRLCTWRTCTAWRRPSVSPPPTASTPRGSGWTRGPMSCPACMRHEGAAHHRPVLQRVHRADDAAGEIWRRCPGTASSARSWPGITSRNRRVYLACCAALRLDPGEVMMVAAHNARSCRRP
jgi:2-haloacid dehalogenase